MTFMNSLKWEIDNNLWECKVDTFNCFKIDYSHFLISLLLIIIWDEFNTVLRLFYILDLILD